MNHYQKHVDVAAKSYRSQMLWSGAIAVIMASLALYQIFGRASGDLADSTVARLESRTPATIK